MVNFCCAVINICFLYSAIVFYNSVGGLGILLAFFVFSSANEFTLIALDYGSRPLLYSKTIKVNWCRKIAHCNAKGRKAERLCANSCAPMWLRMGPFHQLDRSRFPALIRFCLQRTFFLIVNTRD